MRGEIHAKHGPKISMIRTLITPHTDFLILTETRAHPSDLTQRNSTRIKLRHGLKISHHSSHPQARKGVIICSKPEHIMMEGSARESENLGHIAAAVYEIRKSRTVIIGVYGLSENNDRESAAIIQEISSIASELKLLYNTRHVVIGGDFNAVLSPEDSNDHYIRKGRTSGKLHMLMERHDLQDLAAAANKLTRTWYRRNSEQSSRIDMIFSSIPMDNLRFETTFTTFDHVHLAASFGQRPTKAEPAMKDYILGSDEYLIQAEEIISYHLDRNGMRAPEHYNEANEELEQRKHRDEGLEVHNIRTGRTTLHVFNHIIRDLQQSHNNIARTRAAKQRREIRNISERLFHLKRSLKRTRQAQEKEDINQQIEDIQRRISNEIEAKDKASQMRISNFYKTNIGKMVPETFYCAKDKRAPRKIHTLENEGQVITDQEEIVQVMQQWYERTAERVTPQTMGLQEFLAAHNMHLPQITQDHKEMLEEEFSMEEVHEAIREANEVSAPGPSGQNITFFKLLFMEIPHIMTQAINQMVFVPQLCSLAQFQWIQHRKVVYIPKKPTPLTPSDYRPLSMLEVLYKIPSRILASRLTKVLPTIIGPHQHGFMAKKGIQEPSILATHLIQEANRYNKPLQLVSFDIEKAFDRVSHKIIVDSLRAFGIPEITISAIQHFTLVGYAYVEVNGRKGLVITIRTGSGQGDPLSSILFLMASEPLNFTLATNLDNLMYTTEGGLKIGPILFADDNLNPLTLPTAADLQPLLQVYAEYQQVSGLNVNIRKTQALCINTPGAVIAGLQALGIETPEHIKHLGLHLGQDIESTVTETMNKIDPKALKRRILATTPPTDLLHRALLIKTALIPIYNHVFMSLPTFEQQSDLLHKEVLNFLWTRQVDGNTVCKRRLVAKNRIPASHEKGGLQVQHPAEHAGGLQLNLIQRIYQEGRNNQRHSRLPELLQELLQRIHRPTLHEHVQQLGPSQWDRTGQALSVHNKMFGQAFTMMSKFLTLYETQKDSWYSAAINGHSLGTTFPLTEMERRELDRLGLYTVSQLFEVQDNLQTSAQNHPELFNTLRTHHPNIHDKLSWLCRNIRDTRLPRRSSYPSSITTAQAFLQQDNKLSRIYRKKARKILDDSIGIAPAYETRRRDGVHYPSEQAFNNAYKVIAIGSMPSKTKETSFQVLNRTIWTNRKAHRSGIRDNPKCDRCEEEETMEHLLYGCENYSAVVWSELSTLLTNTLAHIVGHNIGRIDLTINHIVFNIPHQSLGIYLEDQLSIITILHLIQEQKRDIICRRMTLTTPRGPIPMPRIHAHILSVLTKITSLLEYQGAKSQSGLMHMMRIMHGSLLEMIE